MSYSIVLRVALPTPLHTCFDYIPPNAVKAKTIQPGMRVQVPFGARQLCGFVTEISHTAAIDQARLKMALQLYDKQPFLSSAFLQLAHWLSDYYHHPLGETLATMVPKLLRQGKTITTSSKTNLNNLHAQQTKVTLTKQQCDIVNMVEQHLSQFNAFLLHGVTGSGKTEIYLNIINSIIAQNKQALVLIPEIGLTPQILARFQQYFSQPITVIHSGLTDKERAQAWLAAKHGQASIILGTRSAVFTPFANLGLIIVDEEHDLSFKQQSGLRYSARDTAVRRAQLENIPIILGSATPSLESYHNTKIQRYQLLTLNERAGNAQLPKLSIIDLRKQPLIDGLSDNLLQKIHHHIAKQQQVLIFLNRRGYAPTLLCHECGWVAQCSRCDNRLTIHKNKQQLRCHHCGHQQAIPEECATCQSQQLLNLGVGTERLEQTLTKHFPNVTITRIDHDTTRRKHALQEKLDDIHGGKSQILIGTQMLAKGHHFPNVTLVGIIDVDSALFSTDFRASEHMTQLILQVAGRAGRADKPGEVIIQTHQPDHPVLQNLLAHDYTQFVKQHLTERQQAQLPPYHYMALIRAEAVNAKIPLACLQQLQQHLQIKNTSEVTVWGPVPAPIERLAGRYRAQLLLVAAKRKALHTLLNTAQTFMQTNRTTRKIRWSIDVDPLDMG